MQQSPYGQPGWEAEGGGGDGQPERMFVSQSGGPPD
jgi:hypothetical protein